MSGIIAEYDPLHTGHAWHIAQTRKSYPNEPVVVVMSCCFTQRGAPALFSPHARAEMALRAGADIVLGLPVSFSVCNAERFALGGVSILSAAGLVKSLSFGTEPGNEDIILPAAQLLESPDASFLRMLRDGLDRGLSFAHAQGDALAAYFKLPRDVFSAPNTVLGICYARANLRLHTNFDLLAVPRYGGYHAESLPDESSDEFPSAAAVRSAFLRDGLSAVTHFVPSTTYDILSSEQAKGCIHTPDALDDLLRWTLRTKYCFSHLPDLSEGIENRLPLGADCITRNDMVQAIRAKRYPYARINRLLTHVLLDTHAQDLSDLPSYAYLLGFRRKSASFLHNVKSFPLLPRLTPQASLPDQLLDARAWDLWALGAHQPFGQLYRCKPVIF